MILTRYQHLLIRCILLVLVALSAPVACASAAEPYDRQIIWKDKQEHTSAMFIPERLLNERTLENLPVTEADRSELESRLGAAAKGNPERAKEYKRIGRELPLCAPVRLEERRSDASSLIGYLKGEDLPDYAKSARVAFVGTIEDVVPGWGFWGGGKEVNMVYIKPSLILRGKLLADRVLVYGELWGSLVVKGIQICSSPPEKLYSARKGDQILVRAFPNPLNSRVLDGASIFPISDGKILSQPYSTVQEFDPIAIDDLRRIMGSHDEQN